MRWLYPTVLAFVHETHRGAFVRGGWQVTLCDPIWQVTLRSCEMDMGFH